MHFNIHSSIHAGQPYILIFHRESFSICICHGRTQQLATKHQTAARSPPPTASPSVGWGGEMDKT